MLKVHYDELPLKVMHYLLPGCTERYSLFLFYILALP